MILQLPYAFKAPHPGAFECVYRDGRLKRFARTEIIGRSNMTVFYQRSGALIEDQRCEDVRLIGYADDPLLRGTKISKVPRRNG